MKKTINERKVEESKLVAVAINDGNITTLITENGRYVLSKGNLVKVEKVNYAQAVKEEMVRISERLASGQFGGAYNITYDGKLNFPVKLT